MTTGSADRGTTTTARSGRSWHRLAVALLLVLTVGPALSPAPAGAQSGDSYRNTADGLDWSVAWDGGVWESVETGDAADLTLQSDTSTVSFLADTLYDGDAADCVAGELGNASATSSVTGTEDLSGADIDLGDQDGETRAWAGLAITSADDGGDETVTATTVLCQTITPGESVLIVYHLVPLADLPDIAGAVADLVASIATGDDEPVAVETPEAAETDDGATGADADAGTYVSPSYGYGLSWEPGDWEVEADETLRTLGRDRLTLFATDTATRVYYEGSDEWDGDLDDCLSDLVDELLDVDSDEPLELPNGNVVSDVTEIDDPLTGDGFQETDTSVAAGYSYHIAFDDGDEQDQFAIVDCITLDEDAGVILGVSQIGLLDDDLPELRERVVTITGTLTPGGGAAGTAGVPPAAILASPGRRVA